jgi:hypothetical protein
VKLRTHADVWPIDEKTAIPPKDWTGWPDGKKFAFVLTHDVDTAKGHEHTRQMADLERGLGFTSSYNFVPERYKVSEELRNYLTENGFEVGVHGLKHDGKYYNSRAIFRERALKINRYIRDWGSVGFRSPSMLHNMAWLHELDIQYDSSTFDTDPFEPQSDGVGTIYPFWVPSENASVGYVEIPYTLPQDFTLFILMKHKNIDVWKRKLDWIASKGGMALMLVHPDYMSFNGGRLAREEYPAKLYKEFLEYVVGKYNGAFWHVLPREVSTFWKTLRQRNSSFANKASAGS